MVSRVIFRIFLFQNTSFISYSCWLRISPDSCGIMWNNDEKPRKRVGIHEEANQRMFDKAQISIACKKILHKALKVNMQIFSHNHFSSSISTPHYQLLSLHKDIVHPKDGYLCILFSYYIFALLVEYFVPQGHSAPSKPCAPSGQS